MFLLYLGPQDTLPQIRSSFPVTIDVGLALDERSVDEVIGKCDVILDAYMRIPFHGQRLQAANCLKLFVTATTGADHIDAETLNARGIPLWTLRGQSEVLCGISAAAEHSWLLLMACARQLRGAMEDVLAGQWDRNQYPGAMLKGKTLGIVGCGRIGQWMSRYANAFGMNVIGFDPVINPWPENITEVDLPQLLMSADFVTVHVPLNDETRLLIGPAELGLMKSNAVLVNTSRGDVVDESELLRALLESRLGAAGLDVLSGEPDVSGHPLIEYARRRRNLIITPHIAGFSPDALKRVLDFSCGRIREFFFG